MSPAPPPIRFDDVRALFPGADARVYLDTAVTGLLPRPARVAIERYLDAKSAGTLDKLDMHATVENARGRFARLVGGEPDEVAITKNVSEGLNLFAASLPWEPGDNVVLCPHLEHPNNVFLWYNLQRRSGIEVRAVEPEDGRVPVAAFARAIDARTRVVTVPHISFFPGLIADVAAIADAAHRERALVLVDAAQSAGAIHTDVRALGIDALAVATQKSLLALYGFGFLWVRGELADSLVPAHLARYGVATGEHEGETSIAGADHLRFRPGARRFDLGNYNYLAAAAAAASLELIESIGPARIETHVRRLAARLAHGLRELELPVTPAGPVEFAHIATVGHGGRHDDPPDPPMTALHDHLTAGGVRLSLRGGALRFATAVYNSDADIDRVIDLARAWTRDRAAPEALP